MRTTAPRAAVPLPPPQEPLPDDRSRGSDMTPAELLRVCRLIHRYGMTPAQAAAVAGLAWGASE